MVALRRVAPGTQAEVARLNEVSTFPHEDPDGDPRIDDARRGLYNPYRERRTVAREPEGSTAMEADIAQPVRDLTAAILDRASPDRDAGWTAVASAVPGASFYSYDYDARTFEAADGDKVRGRGAILGSYWTEIIPGHTGDMSFTVPTQFEVDLRLETVTSTPLVSLRAE